LIHEFTLQVQPLTDPKGCLTSAVCSDGLSPSKQHPQKPGDV
jgi:hypothetical protein